MKTCFVKGAHITPLSWESLRYPGPGKLLDSLPFGALDFSLMVELESDTWVISGDDIACGSLSKVAPGVFAELVRLHRNTFPAREIPWGEYDCVISYEPIVNKDIIKRHPRVLWCYREMSVNHGRAEGALKRSRPHGGYDLYLEERFRAPNKLKRIPQAVAFPYAHNPDTLRGLVKPTCEPAVFIEPRNIPQLEKARVRMCAKFSKACGLPIRHAPFPEFNTTLPKFLSALVSPSRKKILRTADYLDLVGSCKYYLSWRRRLVVGQSLLEAAALGLILVAPSRSPYSPLLCHPKCLTIAGESPTVGLERIARIEKDRGLQAEILAHQDKVLRETFWERPLEILDRALKMKRG